MNKLYLAIATLALAGCGNDPLENIKNGHVKHSELTIEQLTQQYEYCQSDTQQWVLVEEERKDRHKAIFSCNIKTETIEPHNEKLLREAKQVMTSGNQRLQSRLRGYAKRRDTLRRDFRQTYATQCADCNILDDLDSQKIDELALLYYQDKDTQDATIQALRDKVRLDDKFYRLGETLYKISEVQDVEPDNFNAVSSITYLLDVTHWVDDEEFDLKEKIKVLYSDGNEDQHGGITANNLIDNNSPVKMIPRSYGSGFPIF